MYIRLITWVSCIMEYNKLPNFSCLNTVFSYSLTMVLTTEILNQLTPAMLWTQKLNATSVHRKKAVKDKVFMLDYFLDLRAVKLLWKICMGFLCAKNVYVGKLTENVVKTFCNSIRLLILHVTKLHTSELSCMNIFTCLHTQ